MINLFFWRRGKHARRPRNESGVSRLDELESRLLLSGVAMPSHIVVVIEENHSYSQIIGSSDAPYINSLSQQGALMTNSFAIEHPSQPNYLDLFSGSNQGVGGDGVPSHTFSTPNLGGELIAAGLTFTGYSEDLPSAGFTGKSSQDYVRKHNPWVNFEDIPAQDNLPFEGSFPSDFNQLPTLSIVVPNLSNDMHDGSVQQGDAWLHTHLDAYVQWAQTHNSLLVVTWDEDDFTRVNHIPTLFVGPMVVPGRYSETIDHFDVLRTLEDAYDLPYAGASAEATPITDIWTPASIGPTLTSSAQASVFGQNVMLTANAGCGATGLGTATFFDGTPPLGTAPLVDGSASISIASLAVGTHTLSATFSADSGIERQPHLVQTVNRANTTTTLTSEEDPAGLTQTFQATVSVNPPGSGVAIGTVTFQDRKKILGTGTLNQLGQATLTIPTFKHGKHLITAIYGTTDHFNSSQSAVLMVKGGRLKV
ncbi:MAG: hypothetical protein JWN70_698 [Planctomycetaceae bacterium]|nr:hypothetical protein [Planctomycetaceae bacterium]